MDTGRCRRRLPWRSSTAGPSSPSSRPAPSRKGQSLRLEIGTGTALGSG